VTRPAPSSNGSPSSNVRSASRLPEAPTRAEAVGVTLRRARVDDVPGIAGVMAGYVEEGTLLPRSVGELYRAVPEFHVAVDKDGKVVACAALRILWMDLGEVRSLAVTPQAQGLGLGAALVGATLDDARARGLHRVIALTKEVGFFERVGFSVVERDDLPRKVWTDCVACPKRHACDEVAVEIELVEGAAQAARAQKPAWRIPVEAGPVDGAS
jgi:amino-acid N-acetyltransferase